MFTEKGTEQQKKKRKLDAIGHFKVVGMMQPEKREKKEVAV